MISLIRVFLIGLFTALISIPSLFIPFLDRTFKSYFFVSRIFSGGVLLLSGVKLKVKGLEHIDVDKTYVFVANHSSMFDIPALQKSLPVNTSMVYKEELNKVPLFGWQLKFGPYIYIDRKNPDKAMKSIERAKKLMSKKKISVVLFAEGTRSKDDSVQPFKRGAFYLATRVNHPIVPVSISGTNKIMSKGKLKINPGTITVTYDKPIDTTNIKSKVDELALMEKVREIVIQNKEV